MNKGIVAFLGFAFGGVAGFFAGRKLTEQHYNQMVEEEIESVKRAFRNYSKAKTSGKKEEKKNNNETVDMKKEASRERSERKDYRAYYDNGKTEVKQETESDDSQSGIYVISPDDFDSVGYDTISLKYYSDGVVADDYGEPMSEEEIENSITRESLSHFGEYEEDSVFVRNDLMKTDYEILMTGSEYCGTH